MERDEGGAARRPSAFSAAGRAAGMAGGAWRDRGLGGREVAGIRTGARARERAAGAGVRDSDGKVILSEIRTGVNEISTVERDL